MPDGRGSTPPVRDRSSRNRAAGAGGRVAGRRPASTRPVPPPVSPPRSPPPGSASSPSRLSSARTRSSAASASSSPQPSDTPAVPAQGGEGRSEHPTQGGAPRGDGQRSGGAVKALDLHGTRILRSLPAGAPLPPLTTLEGRTSEHLRPLPSSTCLFFGPDLPRCPTLRRFPVRRARGCRRVAAGTPAGVGVGERGNARGGACAPPKSFAAARDDRVSGSVRPTPRRLDASTPRLLDSSTPRLPDSPTPRLLDSSTPRLLDSGQRYSDGASTVSVADSPCSAWTPSSTGQETV